MTGNHDHRKKGWYARNGFLFAADALVLEDIYLTHRPAEILPAGCTLNVHGHLHDWPGPLPYPHCRLVSLEKNDYAPVRLDTFTNQRRGDELHNVIEKGETV